jgi:glycine cleavage system H protein
MKKFTTDHEWVLIEGDVATVGITNYAQKLLGDLVFVDLPDISRSVERNEAAGAVESVKAASDIYAPLSGEIIETNEALIEEPQLVNNSPTDRGWFFRIKIRDRAEIDTLLDEGAYAALIAVA